RASQRGSPDLSDSARIAHLILWTYISEPRQQEGGLRLKFRASLQLENNMSFRGIGWLIVFGLAVIICGAGVYTRDIWTAWLSVPDGGGSDNSLPHAHASDRDRIKLSRQAQANLRLNVRPLTLQSYRRTIEVPGVVVERRGKGDQSIVAPLAGVIKEIHAIPGDVVQPGGAVLTLRLISEPLQTSQTELFKTAQEIKIPRDQKARP